MKKALLGWQRRFPPLLQKLNWTSPLDTLALDYLSGGKRVRPLLALWAYQQRSATVLRPSPEVLEAFWALEFIHAYSLIHDDLPAMDNDDFRRGRPTLHRLWGEGAAILVGDNLLTGAFEVLAQLPFEAELKVALVSRLAHAAGGAGMVGGQWRDIWATRHGQNTQLSGGELLQIHAQKTGALLGASLAFGAMLAQRERGVLTAQALADIEQCGVKLGVLFQVVDDLLESDARASTEVNSGHVFSVAQQRDLKDQLLADVMSLGRPYFESDSLRAVVETFTHRKS